ncbi:MAG: UDP-N-acetylmuramate--L-alanine ligase [Deltaproteobacteria bacterium]|nr:MAG: UDP-N-acetylmuramate--L-alanine ligase [Deltaproteobacteria bacterium]
MKRNFTVHFVGIGGIGMAGIAEVLLNQGFSVSGSDLVESENTTRLRRLGGRIFIGHHAEQIGDCDVVVVSSAVPPDNVEVAAATRRRIPVIPRAEMLAELMRLKKGVAVAGSHGKTTTTSMIATIAASAGLDPTYIVGGRLGSVGESARLGQGSLLIAEADESDGSFLSLSPTIAVVTNIDADHLDHYGSLAALEEAFLTFLDKVPFYGKAIVCLDDPHVIDLLPRIRKPCLTYGLTSQADIRAIRIRRAGLETTYTLVIEGEPVARVNLPLPGRHNVVNSLAAVAVGQTLGIALPHILEGLERFRGVERRFQLRGTEGGVMIVEDYAHHPTEIAATLTAAREGWDRRVVVAFQPHRYTRTRDLFHDFVKAFHEADLLLLTEIYPAGEAPIPGISGRRLFEEIQRHGQKSVHFFPEHEEILDFLTREVRPHDLVFLLGAGDLWRLGGRLLERLREGGR